MRKMSAPNGKLALITKTKGGHKMTIQDKRDLALALAKEAYQENNYAALWGSASVLLTEKDLDTVIRVMEKK